LPWIVEYTEEVMGEKRQELCCMALAPTVILIIKIEKLYKLYIVQQIKSLIIRFGKIQNNSKAEKDYHNH